MRLGMSDQDIAAGKRLMWRVRARRLERRMTQAQVARALRVTQDALAKWEQGRAPSLAYRPRLERWLERTNGEAK